MSYYAMAVYFWSILALGGVAVSAMGLLAGDVADGKLRRGGSVQRSFHSAPSHPGY